MRRWTLLALLAALFVIGCGSTPTVTKTATQTIVAQPPVTYVAPESARTPEGAKAAAPSVSLLPTAVQIPTIDARGLHLIESFEGYSRCAYWDPYGRVWTAGYGQTRGIYGGFCFASQTAAQDNLASSVRRSYEPSVRAVGGPFGQAQVDALDSFAYNLGGGVLEGTLRYDLQSRSRWSSAEVIMLSYDHAGGQVLAGLARRRREEVALFRSFVPPAETAAQHRARVHRERVARLDGDYRARRGLNSVLARYACLHGYRGFSGDRRRKCTVWRAHHGQVSRDITRLHSLGIR